MANPIRICTVHVEKHEAVLRKSEWTVEAQGISQALEIAQGFATKLMHEEFFDGVDLAWRVTVISDLNKKIVFEVHNAEWFEKEERGDFEKKGK